MIKVIYGNAAAKDLNKKIDGTLRYLNKTCA